MKITFSPDAHTDGESEVAVLDHLTGFSFQVKRPGVPDFDGTLLHVEPRTNRAYFTQWSHASQAFDGPEISVDIATITELVYL